MTDSGMAERALEGPAPDPGPVTHTAPVKTCQNKSIKDQHCGSPTVHLLRCSKGWAAEPSCKEHFYRLCCFNKSENFRIFNLLVSCVNRVLKLSQFNSSYSDFVHPSIWILWSFN